MRRSDHVVLTGDHPDTALPVRARVCLLISLDVLPPIVLSVVSLLAWEFGRIYGLSVLGVSILVVYVKRHRALRREERERVAEIRSQVESMLAASKERRRARRDPSR